VEQRLWFTKLGSEQRAKIVRSLGGMKPKPTNGSVKVWISCEEKKKHELLDAA